MHSTVLRVRLDIITNKMLIKVHYLTLFLILILGDGRQVWFSLARIINSSKDKNQKIKIYFFPNIYVTLGELYIRSSSVKFDSVLFVDHLRNFPLSVLLSSFPDSSKTHN